MAGEPDIVEKLKQGHQAAGKTFKVHIDGYNLLPYLTGQEEKSPRQGFIYFDDDGNLVALRFDNWKIVFMEQRVEGTLRDWAEPFVALRVPKLFNLRTDPFERADVTSNTYYDWLIDHVPLVMARRRSWFRSWRRSRSSRRGRKQPASRSIKHSAKMSEAASGARG